MRIWIPTLPVVLLAAAADEADAQTLCTRATMNDAAAGQIVEESFRYGGTDRFLCTYLPSSIGDGALHPLMIALHGGSGNASQMMADNHGIIAAAEAAGYVAVFPNGLPRGACGALPCLDNNWSQPENVFFVAELIERQKATGRIDDDRVHLVGFSGGAKLIYDIVATPGFPHAIDSVATVAGAFGLFHVGRPEEGFDVTQLQEGTPVSALLVQGALDDHLPAAGGLDHTGLELHVSFRTKVDYWRLATGTADVPAQAIDVPALDPQAPADLEAFRYTRPGATVAEILDPGLPHGWPDWNVMAVAVDLFARN